MKKCNLILGVLLALIVTTKATATEVMENLTESVIEAPVATPGGIDISDEVTLDAVTDLKTCSLSKNKVRLTWEAVEGADYYRVTRTNLKGKSRTELAQIKKCTFTDTTLTYNKDYIYFVTPVKRIETEVNGSIEITLLEGPKCEIIFSNKKVVATDHQKYSYTEMESDIELLYEKYNGLISYSVVGQSTDGRMIYDVVIRQAALFCGR